MKLQLLILPTHIDSIFHYIYIKSYAIHIKNKTGRMHPFTDHKSFGYLFTQQVTKCFFFT